VNPGQVSTFPWLSKQAAQWEKYRWEYLEFYYNPEVSAFATNGQSGKIILSMDYDASDAPPSSKQQAEDTDPHTDAMPYEDLLLALDPRQMFEMADSKYIRPAGLPGSSDIKTYDSGNLAVSTIGNHDTTLLGELHVRYAVVFEVPVLEAPAGGSTPANNQVSEFNDPAFVIATGVPTTAPLATTLFNGANAVNVAGTITLAQGNYLVDAITEFSGGTAFTHTQLQLVKNGTPVASAIAARSASAGAVVSQDTLNITAFVQANGTDTVSLLVTGTSAAGVITETSVMRLTLI